MSTISLSSLIFGKSLTVDGSLTAQLLQHLGGTGQSVTRLANTDVEDELLDAQLTHGVGSLVGLERWEFIVSDRWREKFRKERRSGIISTSRR